MIGEIESVGISLGLDVDVEDFFYALLWGDCQVDVAFMVVCFEELLFDGLVTSEMGHVDLADFGGEVFAAAAVL